MPASTLARTIARNTLFITLGSLALKVINTAYQIYIVRGLGDEQFGRFSMAVAWSGLFSIFVELGITQYAMRESARDPGRARWLFWNVAALRGLLALAGIAGITAGAAAVGYPQDVVQAVLLYSCTYLIAAVAGPLEAVLTARERFDNLTAITVIGQLSSAGLGTVVLLNGWGIAALAAVGLLAMLPPLVLAAHFVRRDGAKLGRPLIDLGGWRALVTGGLPFGMITLALTIAFGIDTVMLSWFVSDAEVGWYNVAYGFSSALLFVFTGFSEAIVPSLTKTNESDPDATARWYARSLRLIVITGLPIAAGAALLAYPALLFVYGADYGAAALSLRILAWDVPLLMLTSFCGNMTTVTGTERAAARIYGINAIANIALNAVAIPFAGIHGAAIVTVATDLIGAIQFYRLFRHKLPTANMTQLTLRVAGASALMSLALAALLGSGLHVIGLAIIGAGVYAGAAHVLGVLDAAEKSALLAIARRLSGLVSSTPKTP